MAQDLVAQNTITGGAVVDEYLQTNKPGIFSCGNVLHVHDIVDNVTKEAERAGENCAKYIKGQLDFSTPLSVKNGTGVRYVNPQTYYKGDGILNVNFRVSNIYENVNIVIKNKDKEIRKIQKRILLPAEMETVVIAKRDLSGEVEISIE